jgi:predicted nucleic acid-binding Zn ribbon protein
VAHTCIPSYSVDRDQEDCDSKPVLDKNKKKKGRKKSKHQLLYPIMVLVGLRVFIYLNISM